MITFKCPSCTYELRVKDEYAGKTGKCKRCNEGIRIPSNDLIEIPKPKPVVVSATRLKQVLAPAELPPPPPSQPQHIQQTIVYVQAPQVFPRNGLAVLALVLSMLTLLMCWLPGINVILLIFTAVIFVLALLNSLLNRGVGLMHLVAALIFGFISFVVVVAQIAAVGRATQERFEREQKILGK